MRYWLSVRTHINEQRTKRLEKGDRVVFYEPRPVQKFTHVGEVLDGGRVEMLATGEAPIQPLIESLEFITDKQQWGWIFRRGFFEIGESDFAKIAAALSGAESSLLAAAPSR